jgi:hypothetical protein
MSVSRQRFHVTLHARPPGTWRIRKEKLETREIQIVEIPSSAMILPFAVSFEEAFEALSLQPRLFIEPDGSFVRVSPADDEPPWQVDGQLFDRDGRLIYVELKGTCSRASFAEVLAACGVHTRRHDNDFASEAVIQLVRHALIVELAEFCECFLGD